MPKRLQIDHIATSLASVLTLLQAWLLWPYPSPAFGQTLSATYYVATTGSDLNDGRTSDTAFKSIEKAAEVAQMGDLVWIRGGTYKEYVRFLNSGSPTNPIVFEPYPGEHVVIDGSLVPTDLDNLGHHRPLLKVVGNHITLRGLEAINAALDTVLITGTHATLENLHIHHGYRSGIRLVETWDARILNSIIDHMFDYGSEGQDADCISVSGDGPGGRHTFKNNTLFDCSDDGLDTWKSTGNLIEGNIAHHMGQGLGGNGFGFKLGPGGGNIVRFNISHNNRTGGFTTNGAGFNRLYNNTAFRNPVSNFVAYTLPNSLINNLSAEGEVVIEATSVHRKNSWNFGIVDPAFVSTDPASLKFLHLSPISLAIDAGLDAGFARLGLTYIGTAPDLGAYEFDPSELQVSQDLLYCLPSPINTLRLMPDEGAAYVLTKEFGALPDDIASPSQSSVRIFENGIELGPPHSSLAEIRSLGAGRFSHWTTHAGRDPESLRLSSSDNSDPRSNGRTYTYCFSSDAPIHSSSP